MNTVRRIWSSYCPTFYRGNLLLYLWPPFPPASQLYGSDAVSTLETAHPDADDQRSLPKSYQHVDVPTRENNTGLQQHTWCIQSCTRPPSDLHSTSHSTARGWTQECQS